jgi:hypothetical protein
VVREVDAGALVAALEKLAPFVEKTRGVTLTYTDLLIALVARVLPKHPRMNASWTGDGIRLHRDINVGIAVAVSAGVVVAAMHKADTTNLDDIAVQRRDVAERARMGRRPPISRARPLRSPTSACSTSTRSRPSSFRRKRAFWPSAPLPGGSCPLTARLASVSGR